MENEKMKKSNAKPIILAIIAVLIVALIALGVVYKLRVVGNPVTLTTVALESLGESLEDAGSYGKIAAFLEDEDTVQLNMTGNVTLPMDYGTLTLDVMAQEDMENEEAIMDLDVKLNGEDSIYLEGQLDKNALYFAFKENASKYYYLTDLKYPETSELDIDSFLDKIIESIEEEVKKEDFVESKKDITVNNEKINAKQYSLKITNDLMIKLYEKLFTKIENDKELMNELVGLSDLTETELKESFDTLIEDIKQSEENEEFYYNIYVYKNTAVRFEFTDADATFMFDDYKNREITLLGTDDYGDETKIILTEKNNEWEINITGTGFSGTGTISDAKYDLTLKAEDVTIKVKGTNEVKEVNEGLDVLLKGNIAVEQQGTTITVPYEFDIKLKEIEKVTLKNTTNKVDVNNMTEAEQNEFSNELMQIPLLSMFVPDLSYTEEYSETYNDDIYTDYGYGIGY